MHKRIGKFELNREFLDDEPVARAIYKDMIVWKAEADFVSNKLTVFATHPDFASVSEGTCVPVYDAIITQNPETDEISVDWQRVDIQDGPVSGFEGEGAQDVAG